MVTARFQGGPLDGRLVHLDDDVAALGFYYHVRYVEREKYFEAWSWRYERVADDDGPPPLPVYNYKPRSSDRSWQ